jgi:hypothetical protein
VNPRDRPSTSTEDIDVAWVAAYALARAGVREGVGADVDALVVLADRRRDVLEEALAKLDALTDVDLDDRHAARTLLREASASLAEGPTSSS